MEYPFNPKLKLITDNYYQSIETSSFWFLLLKCDPAINDWMRWIGSIGKFFSCYRGIFSHFPRGLQLTGLHRSTLASSNFANWSIVTRPEFFAVWIVPLLIRERVTIFCFRNFARIPQTRLKFSRFCHQLVNDCPSFVFAFVFVIVFWVGIIHKTSLAEI